MKRKLIALFLAIILPFTMLPSFGGALAADEADIQKSINVVIDAVDNLKGVMSPEEASAIASIFSGFATSFSAVGSFVGPITGTVSFLKLIGLMEDGTATALANITQQLTVINEKLSQMDTKLDMITEQMQVMQATSEFNARAIKASQMLSGWHSFEANYMEDKMDEVMRQYNVMLLDGMKAWIENRTDDARHQGGSDLDKVVLLYRCTNLDEGGREGGWEPEYELQITDANKFAWSERKDAAVPDAYTIYADEYNSSIDRYLILDETFFPEKGEMSWNVDTYRENLKNYIKQKITGYIKDGDYSHFTAWNFYEFTAYGEDSTRTPELIDQIAEDAVNSIVFRVSSNQVNKSSDFPSKALTYYKEYCNHLVSSQQGLDAMMKSMYLTHAFEYEVREDLEQFLDSMALKTGVYGLFVQNVTGMSKSVSSADKENALNQMCSALDSIGEARKNGLTGKDNYCYVTGTDIEYADVTFSASADVNWRHRGTYYAYRSCSGSSIKSAYTHGDGSAASGAPIGDSNAVLLTYVMNANGNKLDHNFMNDHLAKAHLQDRGKLVTSIIGENQLTPDADITLKSQNIIGGYFEGDPVIRPNSLPGSAEFGYMNFRRMITGTVYDPASVKLYVSKPLAGIAAYGENHNLWVVDEAAEMGGPADMDSFTYTSSKKKTDSDVIGNYYYTTHYDMSVTYNCLMSVPSVKAGKGDGYDPIAELGSFIEEEIDTKDAEHVHDWDEGKVTKERKDGEPGIITYTCKSDPSHVRTVSYPATETVKITFDPNGGTFMGQTDPVVLEFEKGSEILLPGGPESDESEFLYWNSEEYPADAAYKVESPETFTAVWKIVDNAEAPALGKTEDESDTLISPSTDQKDAQEPDLTALWIIIPIAAAAAVIAVLAVRRKKKGVTRGNIKF